MMLVIYGPTATGKTDLAIKLAKKYNGEIISVDSRQVYKKLDIGSGKVSFSSTVVKHKGYWIVDGVKIHGFDLVDPGKRFSAADFVKFAKTTMIQIIEVKKLPIIVGGTGFYIKALIEGINTLGIPANLNLRKKLEKLSTASLYQKLAKVDPTRAKSMNQSDKNNPRRLIRAIEIAQYQKGKASNVRSDLNTTYKIPDTKYLLLGLTAPNDYLYKRSDQWLGKRLKKGLIEEVQNLVKQGVSYKWLDNLGLEYRWISRYLLSQVTKEEALTCLKGDIHDFIRRQKTWFNQFKKNKIEIFDISLANWQVKLEKKVDSWYTSNYDRR